MIKKKKIVLVTGSAGFIGFHVSKKLLDNRYTVIGIDCLNNYYDLNLKKKRESILKKYTNYFSINHKIEKPGLLLNIFKKKKPDIVVHLAAQAGVRYSIKNPRSFFNTNILGTFELLEAARTYPPKHILLASSSSVYGSNTKMPFKEVDKTDHQISFYAASKKSTESIAHSYSHLFKLPITAFRFFTVYGPWGRPDMALFKFTNAILNGEKIDVYNHGNMKRDFTYIDDLVDNIFKLISVPPKKINSKKIKKLNNDSISPVAPFRIINIGNSKNIPLIKFIEIIEKELGMKAKKNFLPIQAGDVNASLANTNLLKSITNSKFNTSLQIGISKFIKWYKNYYKSN